MKTAVMTYRQALAKAGSDYRLERMLDAGELHKIERGAYSTIAHPDPLVIAHVLYPDAVITMDSALYAYGLTDVIPDKVHLATSRRSTRISRSDYQQYFTEDALLDPGAIEVERDEGPVRVYNRERMLVEVMRRQAKLPLDYYKEIINSYRRVAHDLDMRLVEDYIDLFKKRDFMFDILQREVL
ncbi:hypothetical protein [Adlercreutzia sp. ZJ473]|uniref:type IV toxin-antitoxin system AbiEi family antitoxin domain-containing protein n=1 Tax=Adlercreutzia sp. ZJ473 TaxID=2722822 RepID=UPI00155374B4|nr:hypothetical protein [Adlercreutzia sp. ZJ473]